MDAIEKRARELLAQQFDANGPCARFATTAQDTFTVGAVRAIIAALTPPEGYVLVPSGLLRMVVACAYPVSTEIDSRGYAWSEAYLDQVLPSVKAALSAARPEVKP